MQLTKWQRRRNILNTGMPLVLSSIWPWKVWTEKWVFLPDRHWYERICDQWKMAWMFLSIMVSAWKDTK